MLLTPAEHEVVTLLGRAASLFHREVVARGVTYAADLQEFVDKVHQLQHAVLAQAAGREYPQTYRLLGEPLEEPSSG